MHRHLVLQAAVTVCKGTQFCTAVTIFTDTLFYSLKSQYAQAPSSTSSSLSIHRHPVLHPPVSVCTGTQIYILQSQYAEAPSSTACSLTIHRHTVLRHVSLSIQTPSSTACSLSIRKHPLPKLVYSVCTDSQFYSLSLRMQRHPVLKPAVSVWKGSDFYSLKSQDEQTLVSLVSWNVAYQFTSPRPRFRSDKQLRWKIAGL